MTSRRRPQILPPSRHERRRAAPRRSPPGGRGAQRPSGGPNRRRAAPRRSPPGGRGAQRPSGGHMTTAFVGLGSNLAHPRRQLARAVRAIGRLPRMSVIAVSPAYATAPIGCETPQPDYLNAVIAVSTTLAPRALLHALHSIERRARRR